MDNNFYWNRYNISIIKIIYKNFQTVEQIVIKSSSKLLFIIKFNTIILGLCWEGT